jgi:hypothetical protein
VRKNHVTKPAELRIKLSGKYYVLILTIEYLMGRRDGFEPDSRQVE